MDRNRAWRRQQGMRHLRRLLRVWTWATADLAHRLYHTRTLCSCPMCGNPRRHFGQKTVQERRDDERNMYDHLRSPCGIS